MTRDPRDQVNPGRFLSALVLEELVRHGLGLVVACPGGRNQPLLAALAARPDVPVVRISVAPRLCVNDLVCAVEGARPLTRYAAEAGLDVAAPRGTPIVATAAGVVTAAGLEEHYGLTVQIDHGSGYVTRYAHNMRNAVRVGKVEGRYTSRAVRSSGSRSASRSASGWAMALRLAWAMGSMCWSV